MKRWLFGFIFIIVLAPLTALAAQVNTPEWVPPIERRPTFELPTGNQTQGGVFSAPYGSDDLRGAQYLGPAQFAHPMSISVAMQMRNEKGLLRYANLASEPGSFYYRRFLTPQQIADLFGPSQADYARAIQYFWGQGLAVTWWTQRQMLRVVGPQAAMERAFATHFGWYRKNGVTFYAPTSAPRFFVPLAIRSISGMVTFRHFRKHINISAPLKAFPGFGPGLLLGNSPFDLAAAFDYTGAYSISHNCCKGDGIIVGIVGTDPLSLFDIPAYRLVHGVSGTGVVRQINVTAVAPGYTTPLSTPPPVTPQGCTGGLPLCNPENIAAPEAQLDTEQSSSLAPDATINFYLAYNANECPYPVAPPGTCPPGAGSPQLGLGEVDDELQQIVNDNVADVVSGSYGAGELDFAGASGGLLNSDGTGVEPTIFASLAAEGIAVFFSSGDSGAESCQRDGFPSTQEKLCVSYPSGDPNVVSVGGTTTPIGSDGRLTGLITTWGVQTQTFGGGGGGFSSVFSRPAHQLSIGMVCATNSSCDSTHRLQPDISFNADPVTGDNIVVNCGALPNCDGLGGALTGSIGGTSAAAPDMAAMWALILQACKLTAGCGNGSGAHSYRLGNPAPLIYRLNAAQKASALFDVSFGLNAVPPLGSNYPVLDPGFNAAVGWDAATGWGTPYARNLIKAIVGI